MKRHLATRARGKSRRLGSVLLMVVGLLELLALMGAAWMVTTRTDRDGSVRNVANTQVDMLMEGLRHVVIGSISDSPLARNHVHPQTDLWLASRVPDASDVNNPVWPYISGSMMRGISFESPQGGSQTTARTGAKVKFVTFGGKSYPAFDFGDGKLLLAADTDNDGMPDAALWPAPVGQINGITYYFAVRIIDNNSAINVSTAWRWNSDYNALPGNFFTSNVDLSALISNNDMAALNRFRANNASGTFNSTPIDDSNAARTDFVFVSPYDALFMQLGRRVGNPGYNMAGARYQVFSSTDAMSLAYGFVRRNPNQNTSPLENCLGDTLVSGVRTNAYLPTDIANWAANFDYSGAGYSRRCLLTPSNPTTIQLVPLYGVGTTVPAGMKDYWPFPVKTSINTASFGELWRAFWCVMAQDVQQDNPGDPGFATPFGGLGQEDNRNPYDWTSPQHMFRTIAREMRYTSASTFDRNAVRIPPTQMLLMRCALAAANTWDLRTPARVPTAQSAFNVDLKKDGATVAGGASVTVFGGKPQPFITEVYAHNDTSAFIAATDTQPASNPNPQGYVAIELFNPYSTDLKLDATFCLATMDRKVYPNMQMKEVFRFPGDGTATVPAGGYLLLENYDPKAKPTDPSTDGHAVFRPISSKLPLVGDLPAPDAGQPKRNVLCVPNLAAAFDNELFLMRQANNAGNTPDVMAPLDQFDFTGFKKADPTTPANVLTQVFSVLHYVRDYDTSANRFKALYPGRYDGTKASKRHEGTEQTDFDNNGNTEKALTIPPVLGGADPVGSYRNPFLPIQWCAEDTPGPNALTSATGSKFPFGGFARLGDIQHVPFIGGYVIKNGGNVLEVNSVTMDSSFADDGDSADDSAENVGRFCPIYPGPAPALPPPSTYTPSGGAFDASLCGPMKHYQYTWHPSVPGHAIVQNELHGGFMCPYPPKPAIKGFFSPIQASFHGTVSFINCAGGDISREGGGIHTDAFWTCGDRSGTDNTVEYINCAAWNIAGEPYLWESGSVKRLHYKNCTVANCPLSYSEVGVNDGCVIDEIVLDNTNFGVHFTWKQGHTGRVHRVYINNSNPGSIPVSGWPRNEPWLAPQIIYGLPPDLQNGAPPPPQTQQPSVPAADAYEWTKGLFDWFTTITNVNDDCLPNYKQLSWVSASGATGTLPAGQRVPNDAGFTINTANQGNENAVGVHGLINLNTAPWKVIATIPMLPSAADNVALAKAIVKYRDANPDKAFTNLYDLYKVPEFKTAADSFAAKKATAADGDISPLSGSDGMTDFEERFLLINRISNFVTLRSDSFTCYLMVQGWRGAGGDNPELVVQRRLGMIVDRTSIAPMPYGRPARVMSFPTE